MPVLSLEEFGNLDKEQLKEVLKREHKLMFGESGSIDMVLDNPLELGDSLLREKFDFFKNHSLPLYIIEKTFKVIIYQNKKAADSYYN